MKNILILSAMAMMGFTMVGCVTYDEGLVYEDPFAPYPYYYDSGVGFWGGWGGHGHHHGGRHHH